MEIDFSVAKALASPTRLKILRQLLEDENTSTSLSKNLNKSKSTIVNHIEVLSDAGLVEKDQEEGRRRVVYKPTRKAQTIARGGESKVKFSLVSSIISGLVGAGILISEVFSRNSERAGAMIQEAGQTASQPSYGLVTFSIILLAVSVLALMYFLVFYTLKE